MSKHRGFLFMLMLVPMAITGLGYASYMTVEHTLYQRKVHHLLEKAALCNPAIPTDAEELPQAPPEDGDEPACVDGPNSVFHPADSFDDLVNRNDPPTDPKATDINVRY